jgi:Rad3-related DNA helicase
MSINLKEQIVILDEAHNIEDACREATSFIITKIQLDIAKQEIELASKLSQPEEIISALVFFGFIVSLNFNLNKKNVVFTYHLSLIN